jgi:small subunit ribosomal protein S16
MSVRIRLKRTGSKNNSCFRIVVMDKLSSRDGNAIETLGFYDPRHKDEKVDLVRVDHWISQGAQPSETVEGILKRARSGVKMSDKQKVQKPSKKALAKVEAAKKAAEGATATA